MSAEIIPFPKRPDPARDPEDALLDLNRQVLELAQDLGDWRRGQGAERPRSPSATTRKPRKRPTKKYPPGYFVPAIEEIARRWSSLGEEGVYALMEDARDAGKDWR